METTLYDPYLRHLFDGEPVFNVYNEKATNLSVGAPGPDLLQHCVEMIKKATDHRLVQNLLWNYHRTFRVNHEYQYWLLTISRIGFLTILDSKIPCSQNSKSLTP